MSSFLWRFVAWAAVLSVVPIDPAQARPAQAVQSPLSATAFQATAAARPLADAHAFWGGFGDPLLVAAVTRADAGNLDIAIARARLAQARAGAKAAGAALLPQAAITASAAQSRSSLEGRDKALTRLPGFQRANDLYDADVGASWEIDLFGSLRSGRNGARADAQAATYGVAAARVAIAAETARAYVALRGAQERLAIVHESADVQAKLLELTRARFDQGDVSELDVRQAEALEARTRARVPAVDTEVETLLNQLDVLQGLEPGTSRADYAPPRPIPTPPAGIGALTPQDVLRRRPDVAAAERRAAAADARIGVALADYYPHVSLSGLLGQESLSTAGLFSGPAALAQGVIGLRWRLFDFGRVDAEVAAARGAAAEALAAFRLSALQASAEIETALVDLDNSGRQLTAADDAVRAAARASAIASDAYGAGAQSFLVALDAERSRLDAAEQRAAAQTAASLAAIRLYRASGGGWSAPQTPGPAKVSTWTEGDSHVGG